MIKHSYFIIIIAIVFQMIVVEKSISQSAQLPTPNPAQLAWQEAELGVVFHYDLHVFDSVKYGQGNNRITPIPSTILL